MAQTRQGPPSRTRHSTSGSVTWACRSRNRRGSRTSAPGLPARRPASTAARRHPTLTGRSQSCSAGPRRSASRAGQPRTRGNSSRRCAPLKSACHLHPADSGLLALPESAGCGALSRRPTTGPATPRTLVIPISSGSVTTTGSPPPGLAVSAMGPGSAMADGRHADRSRRRANGTEPARVAGAGSLCKPGPVLPAKPGRCTDTAALPRSHPPDLRGAGLPCPGQARATPVSPQPRLPRNRPRQPGTHRPPWSRRGLASLTRSHRPVPGWRAAADGAYRVDGR
jgi:hypothetical protein